MDAHFKIIEARFSIAARALSGGVLEALGRQRNRPAQLGFGVLRDVLDALADLIELADVDAG